MDLWSREQTWSKRSAFGGQQVLLDERVPELFSAASCAQCGACSTRAQVQVALAHGAGHMGFVIARGQQLASCGLSLTFAARWEQNVSGRLCEWCVLVLRASGRQDVLAGQVAARS